MLRRSRRDLEGLTGHSRSAGAQTKADQAFTFSDRTNTSSGDSKVRPR